MANDDFNPYRAPLAAESKVPRAKRDPEKLKQLNAARNTLLALGGLMIVVQVFLFTRIEDQVEKFLQQDIAAERAQGFEVDPVLVAEERAARIQMARWAVAATIGVGGVFVVLGLTVKKAPLPITIAGLVLYLALSAVDLYLSGSELNLRVQWLRILFIVLLFKAVASARDYERGRREDQLAADASHPL